MKYLRYLTVSVLLISLVLISFAFAFQEGPFKGEKECFNFGKNKNCECHRGCSDGQPGKDPKCQNYCHEDKCKCRTDCNT